MQKGPKLNNHKSKKTTRDNLGINGAYTSMSRQICPIVNNVTPRAFYWIFLTWIYYDFYKNNKTKKFNFREFSHYIRRQDFFFIAASILNDNDLGNVNGKDNVRKLIEQNPNLNECTFNEKYYSSAYGGMNYFNAGLLSMKLITEVDNEGNKLEFPKLSQYGKEIAISFENVIKDTEYYKKYRTHAECVPKDVLKEYGEVININLKGFEECKKQLKFMLTAESENRKLQETIDYLSFLKKNNYLTSPDAQKIREIFYEYFSERGKKLNIPQELKEISIDWEITMIRQYFSLALEYMWYFMLKVLNNNPMYKKDWIHTAINQSEFVDFNLCEKLEKYINAFDLNYEQQEDIFISSWNNEKTNLNDGLKVLLAMNARIENRKDINAYNKQFLEFGGERGKSFNYLKKEIERYKDKTVKEFLEFILDEFLIEQHYNTAFQKMITEGLDGFFYEVDEGLYIQKSESHFRKQDIRATQVFKVATDLEIL